MGATVKKNQTFPVMARRMKHFDANLGLSLEASSGQLI
jgi:hypothetical protein